MVLEATIICIDNSEYVRNSDYHPTRLQAEADAVNLLAGAKTQSNPENSVGVLCLAGKVPRVLVTPTDDLGQVLNSVHGISVEGAVNLPTGVQVAHLALKHRQNKHQRMRIVLFVGSPVHTDKNKLAAVGKKLRKCNVAVDIVSFGEVQGNAEKLEAFISAVNKNNNSNLVTVRPGAVIADVLLSTPMFLGEDASAVSASGFAAAAAAASSHAALQGFAGETISGDGSDDPALMLALRVSLEEERARREAQAGAKEELLELDDKNASVAAVSAGPGLPSDTTDDFAKRSSPSSSPCALETENALTMDEDALLQHAFALSLGDLDTSLIRTEEDLEPHKSHPAPLQSKEDEREHLSDTGYVTSTSTALPGVNAEDRMLQETLENEHQARKSEEDKDQ